MNPPAQLALKADASASAAAKSSSSFHQGLPSRELTYPPKKNIHFEDDFPNFPKVGSIIKPWNDSLPMTTWVIFFLGAPLDLEH